MSWKVVSGPYLRHKISWKKFRPRSRTQLPAMCVPPPGWHPSGLREEPQHMQITFNIQRRRYMRTPKYRYQCMQRDDVMPISLLSGHPRAPTFIMLDATICGTLRVRCTQSRHTYLNCSSIRLRFSESCRAPPNNTSQITDSDPHAHICDLRSTPHENI